MPRKCVKGLLAIAVMAGVTGCASMKATPAPPTNVDLPPDLTATILEMDTKVFSAYNACDLGSLETYFSPDLEFYHDTGGASFDRDTFVSDIKQYVCGKIRRELITDTLSVYPIANYGAIEEGEHIFCSLETGKCEGAAKFAMVWQLKDENWRVTRVLSYDHRELTAAEKAQFSRNQ